MINGNYLKSDIIVICD